MAEPIAPFDVFQLSYFQRLYEQRVLNVLHFRIVEWTGPMTYIGGLKQIGEAFKDQIETTGIWSAVAVEQSEDIQYEFLRVQRVHPTRDIYWQEELTVGGAVESTSETANVAMSVTKRSLVSGREGVGRIQIGGLPVAEMADGRWSEDVLTAIEAATNFLQAETEFATPGMKVRFLVFGPGYDNDPDFDIVQQIPHSTVRTMHRRTVGLGE